jgi:hypothetical protein
MEGNFVSGMAQGAQAANEMINAPAEQSLLSSRAQEAQLNLQEHKQSYAANMAIYSAQQKFAANNSKTDLMTYQGTIEMLDQMAKDPSIASQPKAMDEIRTRKLEAQNGMAKSAKDKLATEADQIEMVGNAVNQAMLAPEDANSWKMAMDAAPPEMKDNLAKAQAYFNSPEYTKLEPLDKQLKQQEVSGHFQTGKMVARSNNDISKIIETQNKAVADKAKADQIAHQRDQEIAIKREKQKVDAKKEEAKKEVDFTKERIKLTKDRDTAVEKITEKQRAILNSVGASLPTDTKSKYMFWQEPKLSSTQNATLNELELEKQQRQKDFTEGMNTTNQAQVAKGIHGTKEIAAKDLPVAKLANEHKWPGADQGYNPAKYEYRMVGKEVQRKLKE